MVVANPDIVTVAGSELRCAPGSLGGAGCEGRVCMCCAVLCSRRFLPLLTDACLVSSFNPPRPPCRVMPGTLARHYAAAGGEVWLAGKPAPVVYAAALDLLELPADQVVAIGDSLEHDVGGAAAAGIDSVFVLGGIHREDVGLLPGAQQQQEAGDRATAGGHSYCRRRLAAACAEHGAAPTYVLPYFSWQ